MYIGMYEGRYGPVEFPNSHAYVNIFVYLCIVPDLKGAIYLSKLCGQVVHKLTYYMLMLFTICTNACMQVFKYMCGIYIPKV